MSLIDTRYHQMFPVLEPSQINVAKRFASGDAVRFKPGEALFDVGQKNVPAWLILQGKADITRRDGLNHEQAIVALGAGQITGEISQLAGRGTLAAGRAGPEGCVAVPFDAPHLRALVIGSAEIGEMIMRAFILRRVGLIESGGAGSVLIGRPGSSEGLSGASFHDRANNAEKRCDLRHLFLFIGADPHAEWLAKAARVNDKGFLLTGGEFAGCADAPARAPFLLETSMPGVFAIGDVRAGSTKRVAAAVGEGAAVVAQIHQLLATPPS